MKLLICFTLLISSGLYLNIKRLPSTVDPDGLQLLSHNFILHDAVQRFGEYPLWNPYFGGGIPWAGYFQNPGISLPSLFNLLFGEVVGLKLKLLLYLFLGALFMHHFLLNYLKFPQREALYGTYLYVASPWFVGKILDGNYNEVGYFLFPLFFVLFLGLLRRQWWGLLFPFLIMNSLADEHYRVLFYLAALLLLMVDRRHLADPERSKWPHLRLTLILFFIASLVGLLMSSSKILPMMHELKQNLVDLESLKDQRGYTPLQLLKELLLIGEISPPRWHFGVGIIATMAAILGIVRTLPKYKALGILLFMALSLSMGENSPLPLSHLVRDLPLIGSMRDYAKYFNYFILFTLCGYAPLGMQWANRRFSRPWVAQAALALSLIQPAMATLDYFHQAFDDSLKFEQTQRSETFYHMAFEPYYKKVDKYRLVSPLAVHLHQYFNVKNNIGTITWYGNLVYPEMAQPKYLYQDEEFKVVNPLERGMISADLGVASDLHWTYNTMTFDFQGEAKSSATINFNYHPFWRSDQGVVQNDQGLISVVFDQPHQGTIHLRYVDPYFTLGLITTVVLALIWIFGYIHLCRHREKFRSWRSS